MIWPNGPTSQTICCKTQQAYGTKSSDMSSTKDTCPNKTMEEILIQTIRYIFRQNHYILYKRNRLCAIKYGLQYWKLLVLIKTKRGHHALCRKSELIHGTSKQFSSSLQISKTTRQRVISSSLQINKLTRQCVTGRTTLLYRPWITFNS